MSMLANANAIENSTSYSIANSLRFNSGSSQYLSRTFGTPTDNKKWTWSGWVKRGLLGAASGYRIFGANDGTTNNNSFLSYYGDNLRFYLRVGGSTILDAYTTAVYRDPSAWAHVVFVYDSANGTAGNRYIVYVNGVAAAWGSVTGSISLNQASILNTNAYAHYHGQSMATEYFDGLLSDIYFIDGQALTPTSFGETNADGVWVPRAYTGSYGNNGFHLDFADGTSTTTLGYDAAGSNDWTLNGMTRAAGVNECWMTDTPTNNYPVFNKINNPGNMTLSNANLTGASSSYSRSSITTVPFPTSGVWWFEVTVDSMATNGSIGVCKGSAFIGNSSDTTLLAYVGVSGNKNQDGVYSSFGAATYTTGDVIGVLVNVDSGTIAFYKQTAGAGAFSAQPTITYATNTGDFFAYVYVYNGSKSLNMGQRTFNYVTQHGSLPSSAKALCTANLP